jgi:hypothetical protein
MTKYKIIGINPHIPFGKIPAIKHLRWATDLSLREAKEAVEAVQEGKGYVFDCIPGQEHNLKDMREAGLILEEGIGLKSRLKELVTCAIEQGKLEMARDFLNVFLSNQEYVSDIPF